MAPPIKKAASRPSPPWHARALLALAVMMGTFLWYSSTLSYGFNAGEELWFCLSYSWHDVVTIFTKATYHQTLTHYRPLWQISYALDDMLWGRNPVGYHIDSVGLLALFSGLLYVFIELLLKDRFVALLTAAVFIISPQMAYQGSYITHRGDALVGIPLLLMLINMLRVKRYELRVPINLVLLTLSFFIKEFSVVFPLLIALLILFQNNFSLRRLKKPVLIELGLYFFATAIFLWFRMHVLITAHVLEPVPAQANAAAFQLAFWVNNFFTIFHEQTLRQHGWFFLYSFVFWTGTAAFLIAQKLERPALLRFFIAVILISRFWGSIAVFVCTTLLFGILLALCFWRMRRPESKTFHSDRLLLFSLLWIVISSLVLFSKREERLVFFGMIGTALILAVFTKDLLEKYRASQPARVGLVLIFILIGIFGAANRSIQDALRPEAPTTQFEQLFSYARMLSAGQVWEGKEMDTQLINTLRVSLIQQRLIDPQNTLLIDSGDLGRRAFWFLIPSRFNARLFGYTGSLDNPNFAVVDMWRTAHLPLVEKMTYERT